MRCDAAKMMRWWCLRRWHARVMPREERCVITLCDEEVRWIVSSFSLTTMSWPLMFITYHRHHHQSMSSFHAFDTVDHFNTVAEYAWSHHHHAHHHIIIISACHDAEIIHYRFHVRADARISFIISSFHLSSPSLPRHLAHAHLSLSLCIGITITHCAIHAHHLSHHHHA